MICWGLRAKYCCAIFASFASSSLQGQSVSNLAAVRVATGLTQPLFVTAPPGDFERLFIVQQDGGIRILNLVTGALNPTPFLTLNGVRVGGEQGLLGMALIQTMPPTESSILISLFRAARLEMASPTFLNSRSRQIRTSPIRVARKSFSASTIRRPITTVAGSHSARARTTRTIFTLPPETAALGMMLDRATSNPAATPRARPPCWEKCYAFT